MWVFKMRSLIRKFIDKKTSEKRRETKRICDQRRYEYFATVYYQEENRRDTITGYSTFVLATLGVIGGILSYYIQDILEWLPRQRFPACLAQFWTSTYLGLLTIGASFLIVAVVMFIRSFFNYTYRYVATPLQLLAYRNKLNDYHPDPETAEAVFQAYLTTEYAEAADQTDRNNVTKRMYLHRCIGFSILALLCMFLAFAPFLVHRAKFPKEPLEIKLPTTHVTLDGPLMILRPTTSLDQLSPFKEGAIVDLKDAEEKKDANRPANNEGRR